MQSHANKSFYENCLRLAAICYAIALYLYLFNFGFFNIFIIILIFAGSCIVFKLIDKKNKLEAENSKLSKYGKSKVKVHTLDRSVKHILCDTLAETCRSCAFSVAAYIIKENKPFTNGYELTREGIILILIFLAYLYVLWFYKRKGEEERDDS